METNRKYCPICDSNTFHIGNQCQNCKTSSINYATVIALSIFVIFFVALYIAIWITPIFLAYINKSYWYMFLWIISFFIHCAIDELLDLEWYEPIVTFFNKK